MNDGQSLCIVSLNHLLKGGLQDGSLGGGSMGDRMRRGLLLQPSTPKLFTDYMSGQIEGIEIWIETSLDLVQQLRFVELAVSNGPFNEIVGEHIDTALF